MWDWIISGLRCAISTLQIYNGAVTALATVFIAIFTTALFRVGHNQLRLQRAYIFGGCGPTFLWGQNETPSPTGTDPEIWVLPDYHNDGLTPGWIEYLLIDVCREVELPRRATYRRAQRIIISDETPPDKITRKIPIAPLRIVMRHDNMMFYGRYYYRDMIRRRRYSSFIYRFRTDGTHERVFDNVHRSYWKWT
jgi:hypothetical protein